MDRFAEVGYGPIQVSACTIDNAAVLDVKRIIGIETKCLSHFSDRLVVCLAARVGKTAVEVVFGCLQLLGILLCLWRRLCCRSGMFFLQTLRLREIFSSQIFLSLPAVGITSRAVRTRVDGIETNSL